MAAAWCHNKKIRLSAALSPARVKPHIVFAYIPPKPFPLTPISSLAPTPVRVKILKWPRKRGHPKSLTTREQVALWDLFLAIISQLDPVLYDICLQQAECSMKYARDIVIACGFGNYVSWPGHGKHPNGGGS